MQAKKEITEELRNGDWPIKAYKVLRWDFINKCYRSIYHGNFSWSSGVNVSDRQSVSDDPYDNEDVINRGFHGCLEPRYLYEDLNRLIVELICEKEDFIAAGLDNGSEMKSAVFAKVCIFPEEYDRIMAESKNLREYEDEDEDEEDYDDDDDWDVVFLNLNK
jgi:hypothetical protein